MNDLLTGAYDLHVHTAPDVSPRKCGDRELAERLVAAGMSGCAIKCHFFETAARAALLKEEFPALNVVGGIVLNRSVGGINPHAVERLAQLGGKLVWFPTMDALEYQRYHKRTDPSADLSGFLPVCGDNGLPITAARDVLALAAHYDLIVCTGHIGPKEGMAILREGARLGVRRMVVTHADNPADRYTVEQQREAVKLGAFIEHSYYTTFYGHTPAEEIVRQIQAVGSNQVILTTDFGQISSPYSDEGLLEYARLLLQHGLIEKEIRQMICENPKSLIGSNS